MIGLIYQWKLALIGFSCFPILIFAGYIHLRVLVLKDDETKAAHEQSAQLACEAAGAIRTVASLTREQDCLRIYSESLDGPRKRSYRVSFFSNLLFAGSQSMTFFVIALVFWYGADQVSRQEFSTTAFFVCLFSVTFSAVQAGYEFSFVPAIMKAKVAASVIFKLLDKRPNIDANSTEGKLISSEEIQGHIRLEGVHFNYPSRPDISVIRNLSISVVPGSYVALVGASGCGKSTT